MTARYRSRLLAKRRHAKLPSTAGMQCWCHGVSDQPAPIQIGQMMEWVLSHQGNNWDEVLMFALPIIIVIVAIKLAAKRNARRDATPQADSTDESKG